jgi:hypothetical protein
MIGVAFVFTTPQRTRIKQDNYFNSIDYYFKGKCVNFRDLGAQRFLVTLDIDTIEIGNNNIAESDYFSGLYDFSSNTVYYLLDIDKKFPDYLELNTQNKNILLIYSDTIITRKIRPWRVYIDELNKIRTEDMIRL